MKESHLKKYVTYNDETGEFFWLERIPSDYTGISKNPERSCSLFNRKYAGKLAFTGRTNAYLVGSIFSQKILAHRAAWLFYYGEYPTGVIDHINGDGTDNRISNLRDVSRSTNQRNRKKNKNNSSGISGVWRDKSRWRASVKIEGKTKHLGSFSDKESAAIAIKEFRLKHDFTDTHGVRN